MQSCSSHIKHTLKAGILSYVLAVSIFISALLTLLIFYLYYQGRLSKSYELKARNLKNLETAKFICLNEYEELSYDRPFVTDLFGATGDSITILKSKWGIWDKFQCVAFRNNLSDSVVFITAPAPVGKLQGALHLIDEGRPLSVAGNTRIQGGVYLPAAGIQSAYVGRVGFTNEALFEGDRYSSDKKIPEIESDKIFKELSQRRKAGVAYPLLDSSISRSFHLPTAIVSQVDLKVDVEVSGNILLHGRKKITFDSLATTEHILAYAPVIYIKSGFEGQGQFFATDTIIVESGAKLTFPSVLYVFNEKSLGAIELQSESEVSGWMIMDGDDRIFRQRVIKVGSGAMFEGYIYGNSYVSIFGEVTGGVTTKRFLVNDFTGVFENYLFNASINHDALDTAFPAAIWYGSATKKILNYYE